MLKNFLTTVSRQLWRNRLFTTLNIIGLSVSICVAWIIFRMVSFEYSFDKQIPGAENIYQVVSKSKSGDDNKESGFAGVSKPIFNALKNDVSGADLVVPLFYRYQHVATVNDAEGQPVRRVENSDNDIQLVSTTADYFNLLPYRWLAGNPASALDAPDKVVLTDTRASVYFPNVLPQNLIGKTIVYDDTVQRRISGIVSQLDFPNSFSNNNNEFIALDKKDLADNNWDSRNSNDLVYIKTASAANTRKAIDQLNALQNKYSGESFQKYNYRVWYKSIPLSQKHFEEQFGAQTRTASKKTMNGLMTVGAFLLLLACINYVNLTTAQLPGEPGKSVSGKHWGVLPVN